MTRDPAEFLYDNLLIDANVIEAARRTGVKKLSGAGFVLHLPACSAQPMREDALLTGPLEPTNQWYALAKISGIKLCQAYRRQYGVDFISAMPTNLYGPGDKFDLDSGHVVPALMRKTHEAKKRGEPTVPCGEQGGPGASFSTRTIVPTRWSIWPAYYSGEEHINVGTGSDITIRELADKIQETVGYPGRFVYDESRPDGSPQKRLDVTRIEALGSRQDRSGNGPQANLRLVSKPARSGSAVRDLFRHRKRIWVPLAAALGRQCLLRAIALAGPSPRQWHTS